MLGYVIEKRKRRSEPTLQPLQMPPDLRNRLREWVDVDEVGADGFWLWLRAVIPLLPRAEGASKHSRWLRRQSTEETDKIEQRLIIYAREQSRLTVILNQYVQDNRTLARRLRAAEAALRTLELAGNSVDLPEDEAASEVAARYVPPRRPAVHHSANGAEIG